MKKLAIVLFLGMFSMAVQAQDLKWYDNVDQASTIAVKAKKPLLLFFTGSDWCGWCIKLQKEVMFTPEFKKWANDNVILVELDYPRSKQLAPEIKQQNAEMQQMFAVSGYPTVWLVKATETKTNVNFEQLGRTGYVAGGPNAWIQGANQILKNYTK